MSAHETTTGWSVCRTTRDHEELWRTDGLYDVVGVLGWNDAPVVRGRGSAIFLHVARPDYAPTEGCIALSLADLRRVLAMGVTDLRVTAYGEQPNRMARWP